jgi:hypothetical protein
MDDLSAAIVLIQAWVASYRLTTIVGFGIGVPSAPSVSYRWRRCLSTQTELSAGAGEQCCFPSEASCTLHLIMH